MSPTDPILDAPLIDPPDPEAFIRAAMRWHFGPDTGTRFWLDRVDRLGFDPLRDVTSIDDLERFPDFCDELRDVPVADLIPRGYTDPDIVGVFESGGTTGTPKRVVILEDWFRQAQSWSDTTLDDNDVPKGANWIILMPSGPHLVGRMMPRTALNRGGIPFTVDLDPRWVKSLIAQGRQSEAAAYTAHVLGQARHILRSQDVRVLAISPPMLERLAEDEELVDLVRAKIGTILWGGAHMDADTRHLLRSEVFPGITLIGSLGNTMILGGTRMRTSADDDLCVFDPPSPFTTFRVVDPLSGQRVAPGERGRVVMNHVSRNFLLPNNLERDEATRVAGLPGQVGDSVADVAPAKEIDGVAVVEGVY
ncbi:phenazine antibiotic biosynthesis protein [Streptomyces sp. XM4011]|uniref:phenazine antibiotic biosynthesis protein n=1 Tax=Streptomyces sp. XM4011 TaxID=2929780 RepID=UPI001FF7C0AC|nr:phenazine antibiotic biosynthesis protein [Streptomyces sp. XM4011]MCK1815686.1 phenazine antibiotic biosynthesis protein [Streptomyces sp. XM4011]